MAQNATDNASLSAPSPAELQAVETYWTDERMKTATPFEPPPLSDAEFKKLMQIPKAPSGTSRVVEPGRDPETPLDPTGGISPEQGKAQRAEVTKWPFKSGGKLFFSNDGKDYSCSAQFVGNKRVIMTAAHCVADGKTGKFHKNFKFVQGYMVGVGRSVGWECVAIKKAWYEPDKNNHAYDYAFFHAGSDSHDYLGIKTLIPYKEFWSIGYPSNYDQGLMMQKVEGYRGDVNGGTVAMMGNRFGKGSSGGAWIGDLNMKSSGKNNYAIGLNSFTRDGINPMYGPYFDDVTFGLWEYVRDKKCK